MRNLALVITSTLVATGKAGAGGFGWGLRSTGRIIFPFIRDRGPFRAIGPVWTCSPATRPGSGREIETPFHFQVGVRLDLLRHEFAQNERLGKVLGANYDAIRMGGRTSRKQQSHHGQHEGEKTRVMGPHRGRRRLSNHPTLRSANSARTAAGIAPARMTRLSTIARPRKMNSPRPPAPIAAAIVASPTEMT